MRIYGAANLIITRDQLRLPTPEKEVGSYSPPTQRISMLWGAVLELFLSRESLRIGNLLTGKGVRDFHF